MEFYKVKLQITKEKTFKHDKISSTKEAVEFINSIENYSQDVMENVIVIPLNAKNEIVAYAEVGKGGISDCGINIANILRIVFNTNATKFILAHNHPSGDTKPSRIDIDTTKRIQEVCNIIGIQLLDHIIIGDNDFQSILHKINKEVI